MALRPNVAALVTSVAAVLTTVVVGCSESSADSPAAPDTSGVAVTGGLEALDPPGSVAGADGTATTAAMTATTAATDPSPAGAVPAVLDLGADADAAAIATALTEAERTIRGDGSTPEQVAAAGRRQQLLYRYLSGHGELDAAVIAAVGDDVRPAVQRTIEAREAVQALRAGTERMPPPATLPAWRIVEPLPAEELLTYYREAETLTGVAWYWLAAINLQETRMGRIDGVSSAGAVGPMQFLPATWADCCTGDPLEPRDAIIGAATYLVRHGAPGDMRAALYGYNPSDAYVIVVTALAENLRDDERAYRGYHAWQVFYESAVGDVRLPIGYAATVETDAATYLATHPEDAAG
ncbi:MAG: lytic transglycosylase domain-containing protein [Acidimicrobiia bacterium]